MFQMPHQKRLRHLSLLFVSLGLALVWSFSTLSTQTKTEEPVLEAWMLDVGQGESVLVKEPSGKRLLFDGGPSDAVLSELGSVLPPWDRSIDLVILSHNHSDHVRGLIDVLDRYDVKEIWISGAVYTSDDFLAFLDRIKTHHIPTTVVYFNTKACTDVCPAITPFGKANLQVYHPLRDMTGEKPKDQHDATLSVKVSYGNRSLFLTGDLAEAHEEDMIHACGPPSCTLAATLLQVPHHGSKYGLSYGFLKAVSPQAALIPVGLNNQFGHPGQSTLDRLTEKGIPIYRTDTQGRIHTILRETGPSITVTK